MLKPSKHLNDIIKIAVNNKTILGNLLTTANKLIEANYLLYVILQQLYPNNQEIANNCYIGKLEKNHLVIVTHSACLQTILRFKKNDILKQFRKQQPYAGLKSLAISISLTLPTTTTKVKPKPTKTSYLSPRCVLLLQQTAETICDEQLKQVLKIMVSKHREKLNGQR